MVHKLVNIYRPTKPLGVSHCAICTFMGFEGAKLKDLPRQRTL